MDIRKFLNRPLSLVLIMCLLLAMAPVRALAAEDCSCTDKCTFSEPNSSCAYCSSAEEDSFSCRGTLPSAVTGKIDRTYGDDLDEKFSLTITGGSGELSLEGDKLYEATVSGTAEIRWNDVLNGQPDVGEHELEYTFTPSSADYRPVSGKLTYKVTSRPVAATLQLSQTSFVYDGTAKTPAVTVTGDGRTLTEGVEYTLKYLNNTAPGTATVQLQDVAGDNYTVSGNATFTITKAPTDLGAVTYSGPALLDSVSPGAVTLTREDTSVPGTLRLTDAVLTAGTKSYNWTFTPSDSGFESVSGTITLVVAHDWTEGSCTQAPVCNGCGEVDGTAPGHTLSYSADGDTITEVCTTAGFEHSATLKLKMISGASTQYTGSEVKPLKLTYSEGWVGPRDLTIVYSDNIDVGLATATVTVGGATVTKKFQITPLSMTVTAKDVTVTYDGTVKRVSVTAPAGATVRYGTTNGVFDLTEAPGYKDAGEYTVWYQVTKENHQTVEGSVKLTVRPVALTVKVDDAQKTYGENDPTFTWRITSGAPVDDEELTGITVTRAAGEDAGTYTITATDNGRNGNYSINFKSGTLTVLQREITITWGELGFTYNGEEQAPAATAGNTVDGDELELTVSGGRTDATGDEGAMAQVTAITGRKAANYKLPADVSVRFVIEKATREITRLSSNNETVDGKNDGQILDVTDEMEYRAEGELGFTSITDTKVEGLAPGVYEVRYRETVNYKASRTVRVTINAGEKLKITLPEEQLGFELTADKTEVSYGGSAELTFRLLEGHQKGEDFALKVNGEAVELGADGKYALEDIREDLTVTVEGVSDKQPPRTEIWIGGRKWDSFQTGVRFDIYYASAQSVTVRAEDIASGVESVYYYLSEKELTLDQLEKVYNWKEYKGPFTIRPENKYIVYVRATDEAGNVGYINSTGLIFDDLGPTITGVRNRGVYYTSQIAAASDNFRMASFKLNGGTFDGKIKGDPDMETTYTLTAWDAAGNSTTVVITVKPISALSKALPARDDLKLGDKAAIEAVLATVSDVLKNGCKYATDEEKEKLEAVEQECLALLTILEEPVKVQALLAELPDAKTARPDDRKAIDALDAAQAAWDALTDEGRAMLGDAGDSLTALRKALTNYKITEGDKAKWSIGDPKGLVFVGNGYCGALDSYTEGAYGKFLGIRVDGKTVDPEHYTAHSGSTIVSLKPGYLETLETGKHTLCMVYTDGETGEVTFRISQPAKAASQDSGLSLVGVLFWTALGLACLVGIALIVLLVLWKKEKH